MIGFTTDQLTKDKRMQLSMELHRNGLSNSKYANKLLLDLTPTQKRPDLASSFKIQ
jgi:hypothetical protein